MKLINIKLIDAVSRYSLHDIKECLDNGADINIKNENNELPITLINNDNTLNKTLLKLILQTLFLQL